MPAGTDISSWRNQIGGSIVVEGAVPSKSYKDTVTFFEREVPKAGFKLLHSESDPPRDAEGTYSGKGYIGGWSLRSFTHCSGAMFFEASAKPLAAG